MESKYKRLGNYVQNIDIRNTNLLVTNLLGVSIKKKFIKSVANTIGTDFKNYKIIKKGQFAYGPVTSRNGDKISVALLEDEECIISSSYTSFEIVKPKELIAEYLNLLFKNEEFDRLARFNSWGSAREIFSWEDFCDTKMYIPEIDKQKKIIKQYNILNNRINLLTKINENLGLQAETLHNEYFSPRVDIDKNSSIFNLDEFCTIFTGKKNSNAAVENGEYKFFTCSPNALQINSFIHDGAAIIISGNGAYTGRTRFYGGKFELYQRTYACTLKKIINEDYIFPLYWIVKLELSKKIMGGTRGSAIPYIVMDDLAKFEFVYDKKKFEKFAPTFKSITEAIQINEEEREKLIYISKSFLLKLMYGEMDF
jgi:type I restriction enzyme S subunit